MNGFNKGREVIHGLQQRLVILLAILVWVKSGDAVSQGAELFPLGRTQVRADGFNHGAKQRDAFFQEAWQVVNGFVVPVMGAQFHAPALEEGKEFALAGFATGNAVTLGGETMIGERGNQPAKNGGGDQPEKIKQSFWQSSLRFVVAACLGGLVSALIIHFCAVKFQPKKKAA